MAKLRREQFVEYFSDFCSEHLLAELPVEAEEGEMLNKASRIIFNDIAHIQAGLADPHRGDSGPWP